MDRVSSKPAPRNPRPPRRGTNLKLLRDRPGMAWTHVTSALGARSQRHLFADVEAYCLFIGHARSGSTLVGSLLSAHREMVIAHELDTLRFIQWRFRRDQLFHLVLRRDAEFHARGHRHGDNGYDYAVADSWQGRFDRLRVIGDKKAGASTRKLADRPELLDRLRGTVGVPLRLIQVTRNPFDNIASISKHGKSLAEAADRYFARCATLATVRKATRPEELTVVKHEDLVAEPEAALRRLCHFLGVQADDPYLAECARIVNVTPNQRRAESEWDPDLVATVTERMRAYPFLDGYGFDDTVRPRRGPT